MLPSVCSGNAKKNQLATDRPIGLEGSVKEIKNVAVLGAGAMGAFYASKFFDGVCIVHGIGRSGATL